MQVCCRDPEFLAEMRDKKGLLQLVIVQGLDYGFKFFDNPVFALKVKAVFAGQMGEDKFRQGDGIGNSFFKGPAPIFPDEAVRILVWRQGDNPTV